MTVQTRQAEIPKPNAAVIGVSDRVFKVGIAVITVTYVSLILLLIGADMLYMLDGSSTVGSNPFFDAFRQPEIRNSLILSMISCTISAFLATAIAIPVGYLLTRSRSKLLDLLDAVLDIPIVLPPLVIGLSLLILFQFWPFSARIGGVQLNSFIVYQVPAVIIAQFTVAAAFAIRAAKITFEQINPRAEQVALTLGCSRLQAFNRVVLPEAGPGLLTAWTLAWARSLGEFGPLLIFAGATRNKTEVLSTTVFLELSIGNIEAAVAVSLIMVIAAIIVLVVARIWGKSDLIA